MARDFTKNTSNYMAIGVDQFSPLLAGAAAISVHAWISPDTFGTAANNNRIAVAYINTTSSGMSLMIHDGTNAVVRVTGRSRTADASQAGVGTTVVPTGQWSSVGGVLNFTGDTITPYYNGVAEGGGAVTFGVNTYADDGTPTASDMIGSETSPPAATANQFDGRIAEVAIWTSDIGAANVAALATMSGGVPSGVSARCISPSTLVFYMPIYGDASPEPAVVSSLTGTIVGSVPQDTHPGSRRLGPRARNNALRQGIS